MYVSLREKVDIIMVCATLYSNSCKQAFVITGAFTSLWRDSGPLLYAELF